MDLPNFFYNLDHSPPNDIPYTHKHTQKIFFQRLPSTLSFLPHWSYRIFFLFFWDNQKWNFHRLEFHDFYNPGVSSSPTYISVLRSQSLDEVSKFFNNLISVSIFSFIANCNQLRLVLTYSFDWMRLTTSQVNKIYFCDLQIEINDNTYHFRAFPWLAWLFSASSSC